MGIGWGKVGGNRVGVCEYEGESKRTVGALFVFFVKGFAFSPLCVFSLGDFTHA